MTSPPTPLLQAGEGSFAFGIVPPLLHRGEGVRG